ncbi:MAG: TetR/AcrR family transcriptional regulator [Acidimicrobiales bacterium]
MPRLAEATKAERRADILAAALDCFSRTGYHDTTMAEVAEAAEVSKGTPYLYFPSKEALFIALHDEWDCGLSDRISLEVGALSEEERTSPRRVLSAVALAVGAHVVEHADTCRVLMEARTLAAYNPQIAAAVERSAEGSPRQLRDLFQAGVDAGEWPSDTDPDLEVLMFTTGLYGLMAQWHLRPGSFAWESAAASLTGAAPPLDTGEVTSR